MIENELEFTEVNDVVSASVAVKQLFRDVGMVHHHCLSTSTNANTTNV